jgi:hypothetical protein
MKILYMLVEIEADLDDPFDDLDTAVEWFRREMEREYEDLELIARIRDYYLEDEDDY